MRPDQVDADFERQRAQLEDRYVWGWISLVDYRRGLVDLYGWCDAKDAELHAT